MSTRHVLVHHLPNRALSQWTDASLFIQGYKYVIFVLIKAPLTLFSFEKQIGQQRLHLPAEKSHNICQNHLSTIKEKMKTFAAVSGTCRLQCPRGIFYNKYGILRYKSSDLKIYHQTSLLGKNKQQFKAPNNVEHYIVFISTILESNIRL